MSNKNLRFKSRDKCFPTSEHILTYTVFPKYLKVSQRQTSIPRGFKSSCWNWQAFLGVTVCNYCVWAQWAEFLPWKGKIGAILGKAVWKMDWNRLKEGDFWRLKWAHSWKTENFLLIFVSRILLPNTAPSQLSQMVGDVIWASALLKSFQYFQAGRPTRKIDQPHRR